MCKCCQTCMESCYWHCFEKWFCYDESIALYEDPLADEKNNRGFDNIAFWDSVAVIANRSVVTIQPLPENKENKVETFNSNSNNNKVLVNNETEGIKKDESKDLEISNKNKKDEEIKTPSIRITVTDSTPEKGSNLNNTDKVKSRNISRIEEKIELRQRSESNAQERQRKKSLKERRKSAAGLTLKLDNDFHEIPVIRQSSMPRFFIDTPDIDIHGHYSSGERSSVLVSPILGNSPTFNYDLKSIVQIEKEIQASQSKPSTPKSNRSSRLDQVRKKLKPLGLRKQQSVPDRINHM